MWRIEYLTFRFRANINKYIQSATVGYKNWNRKIVFSFYYRVIGWRYYTGYWAENWIAATIRFTTNRFDFIYIYLFLYSFFSPSQFRFNDSCCLISSTIIKFTMKLITHTLRSFVFLAASNVWESFINTLLHGIRSSFKRSGHEKGKLLENFFFCFRRTNDIDNDSNNK